ncbi:histidine kinase [Streptomyces sp. HNM0574]|uniref:sensor histidine kinase n=1 Tax=Streptomyces sp. HNM0574 TaxID=2714954 RepID=UPI00146ABF28|nr:histidine kinase [Streptomyces sp. HNM0574]NLU70414.1 two-component sensor histidine kinase [Streptomyces sp. HNM0574]
MNDSSRAGRTKPGPGAQTGTGPADAGHPTPPDPGPAPSRKDGLRERSRSLWRAVRRPVAADCWTTALVLLLSVYASTKNPYLGPAPEPWGNHLLAALGALPLLARRRFPVAVALVSLAGAVTQASPFAGLFAFYAAGAYRHTRSQALTWALAGVGLLAFAPWDSLPALTLGELAGWLFRFAVQLLVPLLIGLYVRERRAVHAALLERAERAEREQRLIAEAARVEERARIAGEMHDVVSHQVSLIVVHANALEAVAHDPETSRQAAATIRTAGRQALHELREMLGVLRRDGEEPARGTGSAEGTGDAPSAEEQRARPTLEQAGGLVAASRAAGLPVTLRAEGERRTLPDPVERAAYRVVQEALTNVHKHAPGAETEVRLGYGRRELRVEVTNGPAEGHGPDAGGADLLPSGGHGLIGLGERVRLSGGAIDTGPRPGGGFQVLATLPVPAEN